MRNHNKQPGRLKSPLEAVGNSKLKKRKYTISAILTFLFFLGGFLTVLEINIYRNTFIVWSIPTAIWISTGFLFTPLTLTLLRENFDSAGIFPKVVYNIVTFGGIICYIFMALNYHFPIGSEKVYQVEIMKTGTLAKGKRKSSCASPYALVRFKGKEKELIFPCGFELGNYKSVRLTVVTGLLGFDIIREKTAIVF
ncbi:hypothetical protein [Pedobacter gandavensis]|uniref:hypothetical protein n=1 Tax=Pedobacter gandavensis TaxID=2679963 RepID=UPI00292D22E0|nr:hypothetical protein [Pedobacter gandavensis]